MDSAKILFDKLFLEYVTDEMIGREFENTHIECKEKERADRGSTDKQDENYFAKALSGFANTSGGILFWGLKARKEDDVDLIQEVKPIAEIGKFESRLRELETRVVERVVAGVEYKVIKTEVGSGLVAVYIPQSPWLPHRSRKDNKFYLRAGGTFQPLDLNIVEDFFFRRSHRPKLELHYHTQDYSIFLSLYNAGRATAKYPYVILELPRTLRDTGHEVDGNTPLSSFVRMSEYQGEKGRFYTFQAGSNFVIHPDASIPILQLIVDAKNQNHPIKYQIYAENMEPLEGILNIQL